MRSAASLTPKSPAGAISLPEAGKNEEEADETDGRREELDPEGRRTPAGLWGAEGEEGSSSIVQKGKEKITKRSCTSLDNHL